MDERLDPPTEYYDEHLKSLDESIVASIARREELSHANPGFPPTEYLEQWAHQYALPMVVLHRTFAWLYRWHQTPPQVSPDQFERFVPMMASVQQDDLLVSVPYLRTYNNCSILVVLLERPSGGLFHVDISLSIDGRVCQPLRGAGSDLERRHEFAVTPVVADNEADSLTMTFHIVPGTRPNREIDRATPMASTVIQLRSDRDRG